jgi:hypothetical protein
VRCGAVRFGTERGMIGPSDRKTAWKGKGTRMASFWLGWWGEGRMRMASDHPLVWRSRLIVVRFPRRSSRRLTPAIPAPAHPEKRETTTTSGTRTGTTRKIKEQKRAADLRVFYVAISAALSLGFSPSPGRLTAPRRRALRPLDLAWVLGPRRRCRCTRTETNWEMQGGVYN